MDYLGGNTKKAAETQIKYLNLINDLFIEVNPIPVSYTHLDVYKRQRLTGAM